MYTPGEADFMKNFNVGEVVATLGLSLFTLYENIPLLLNLRDSKAIADNLNLLQRLRLWGYALGPFI